MGKEKKQPRECAYCGEIKMPTDDHVIPQCLFNKPLPGNMIVVEACQECNSLKSKDDDYLRDYLVTHLSTYEQEVPKRLFEGKMSRSIQRNSSSFAKEIKTSKTTNTPFFSNGERLVAVYLDNDRLRDLLERIVRGLYYHSKGKRIPDDIKIKVSKFNHNLEEIMERESLVKKYTHILHNIGDGNVFYLLSAFLESECEFTSYWMLVFYQKFCVEAKIGLLVKE